MQLELKTTAEIAKRVLPKMGELEVPLTPQNYRVWFEYYLGTHKNLVEEMEKIINSGQRFTPQLNQELYERYFGGEVDRKHLEQIQQQTRAVLKSFLEQVIATTSSSSEFTEKLKQYSARLDRVKHFSEVQEILEGMKKDTSIMIQSTSALQRKLEEATTNAERLRKELRKATREALIDGLTGLHNRKAFDSRLQELYQTFRQENRVFSLVMLDVDHFKVFNDRYGHKVGDEVLQIIGTSLLDTLKGRDLAARYGGEEFAVLLPDTELRNACVVAEQIRKSISEKRLRLKETGEQIPRVTVSLGVAQVCTEDEADDVVKRADRALYLAKDRGRNNIKSEQNLRSYPEREVGRL